MNNVISKLLKIASVGALAALVACEAPPPRRTVVATEPVATRVMVYPAHGQSADQQERDRYECHLWAVKQSGFDPSQPGVPAGERVVVQPGAPPGAGTAVGAVAGAILGAAIGAIAGGGKGAAIGAGIGGGAGAGDVLLTHHPAELPSETEVTFRLKNPVPLTEQLR